MRPATHADVPALRALIDRSARALGAGDYTAAQIDGALRGAFGVDSQLIADGTYFAIERDGAIVGGGGWSRRQTLFGGDSQSGRSPAELDPRTDAAKIRAFFVDPAHARHGLGAALLARCEAEASAHGFTRFELMATLTGAKLYSRRGYVPGAPIQHELGPGLTIEFVPMTKTVAAAPRP